MRLKLSAFLMFFSLAAGIPGLTAQTSFARGRAVYAKQTA